MAIALTNPRPVDLGFASPALGPWFSSDLALGAADADLGVSVTFAAGDAWLPPTAGLLSLFVATAERPYGIAGLRRPQGTPAFSDGRLVAVFRLLPEVEARLHSLMRFVPSALENPPTGDPVAAAAPTRTRVRTFALELSASLNPSEPATCLDRLGNLLVPGYPDYVGNGLEEERDIRHARANYVGLTTPRTGDERIESGDRPMADLKRPGRFPISGGGLDPQPERLLQFPDGMGTRLFVFDDRGLPIDPGAVAAWWHFLATQAFNNLWAGGFEGDDRRTASLSGGSQLTIHLINPHGGTLGDDHALMVRSQLTNVTDLPADAPRHLRRSTSGAVAISFAAAAADSAADNAPFPRVAPLPTGRFAATTQLWPGSWASFSLNRDFIQVALVEAESHLVGVPRLLPEDSGTAITRRRAADQNRPTTRTFVARTTGEILSGTTDLAAQALLSVFNGASATTLVTGGVDPDVGPLLPLTDLPDQPLPERLPQFADPIPAGAHPLTDARDRTVGVVYPLVGGSDRQVVVELALGAELDGAWVRIWAQDFSTRTGSRTRLDGGGGRADGSGQVFVVITLEEGAVGTASPRGLDLLLKTTAGVQEFPDLRFTRPAPVAGDALSFSAPTTVRLCETGQQLTTSGLTSAVLPGATLIALPGDSRAQPVLVNPATVPTTALVAATLGRQLSSGDTLVLTQPAFRRQPDGTLTIAPTGVTLQRFVRNGVERLSDGSGLLAGAPLPSQQRLEIAAAQVEPTGAVAALATTPTLGRFHELLPHQQGHPGAPAAAEFHGTGASLTGPAALLLAEVVRDRRARLTPDLITQAFNSPFPELAAVPDADPAVWVSVLRTAGKGSEGEAGMDALADALTGTDTTPGVIARDVERWIRQRNIDADTSSLAPEVQSLVTGLNSILASLPPATGSGQERNVASAARALDRRLQAARGMREGALSLRSALQRAEDFIYIETPALNGLACGEGDHAVDLWTALRDRLTDTSHRALKLVLCLPLKYSPFAPEPMQTVRDALAKSAIEMLRTVPHFDQRVALFSPNAGNGRSLHLSSTTVIIDDAYLFTGTTHLWRRGLSFDTSLAISLVDERVAEGRSQSIHQFRRQIIANRLGVALDLLPDSPADLLEALQRLSGRDGGRRLTQTSIMGSAATTDTTTTSVWNPDGSPGNAFNLATFLASLTAIQSHVSAP